MPARTAKSYCPYRVPKAMIKVEDLFRQAIIRPPPISSSPWASSAATSSLSGLEILSRDWGENHSFCLPLPIPRNESPSLLHKGSTSRATEDVRQMCSPEPVPPSSSYSHFFRWGAFPRDNVSWRVALLFAPSLSERTTLPWWIPVDDVDPWFSFSFTCHAP